MSNLTQGTLSFPSAKRTNPAGTTGKGKTKKRTSVATRSPSLAEKDKTAHTGTPAAEKESDSRSGAVMEISSEEEDIPAAKSLTLTTVPAKRPHSGTNARSSVRPTKQASAQTSKEKQEGDPVKRAREHLDVEDKAGRYRRYHSEVRSKTGYLQPIHSEGQNRIHQMLRFFDMSYEFGPCIGMTRLERWERAEAFGLNPPVEVRDILLTKEGIENAEYAQCVLHGEV